MIPAWFCVGAAITMTHSFLTVFVSKGAKKAKCIDLTAVDDLEIPC